MRRQPVFVRRIPCSSGGPPTSPAAAPVPRGPADAPVARAFETGRTQPLGILRDDDGSWVTANALGTAAADGDNQTRKTSAISVTATESVEAVSVVIDAS